MTRAQAVAGSFYPDSCLEIKKMLDQFNQFLDHNVSDPNLLKQKSRAIIAPHAGYIYSGFTANAAYRLLKNSEVKKVAVIGPSHRVYLEGISIGLHDTIQTPCGEIKADKTMAEQLLEKFHLQFLPEAHHEHSTETQFPFLRFYLGRIEAIEMVYGKEDPAHLAQIVTYLLEQPEWGVVISTDLSHFYDLETAQKLDSHCLAAVEKGDISIMKQGGEACGMIGIEAIIEASKPLHLTPHLLDYRTSADASNDTTRVVGYMSAGYY